MRTEEVIRTLEDHRKDHIIEYKTAVIGFKKKALELLAKTTKKINKGSLEMYVQLQSPTNRTEYFNNVIRMFSDEINPEVDLTQDEYNEYILDKGSAALAAWGNNTYYMASAGITGAKGLKGPKGRSLRK